MQKRFCDLCERPAVDPLRAEKIIEVGDEFRRPQSGSLSDETVRTKIVAEVHFKFRDHKTGFAGPPDLCAACANNLIMKLEVIG